MSTATNKNGTFEREVHALSGWIIAGGEFRA